MHDPVSVDSVVKGVNCFFNAAVLKKVLLELPEVRSKAVSSLVSSFIANFLMTDNFKPTANFLVLTGKFIDVNINTVLSVEY